VSKSVAPSAQQLAQHALTTESAIKQHSAAQYAFTAKHPVESFSTAEHALTTKPIF